MAMASTARPWVLGAPLLEDAGLRWWRRVLAASAIAIILLGLLWPLDDEDYFFVMFGGGVYVAGVCTLYLLAAIPVPRRQR